jgi:hypothetical protein
MNWGHAITISIVSFMAFILYFVFRMVSYDVDLVTEDYYAKELAYQDQIHKIENSNSNGISTNVRLTKDSVFIQFNNALNLSNGNVQMYRPSDPNQDVVQKFNLNDKLEFGMPTNDFNSGKYIAKLDFEIEGAPCYAEKIIIIP